ncbi:hypothetical protein GOBAR_AA27844 [Gossypium barbadense]|uniref:Uncharacterized protein n=1 Tax=Gossypium barbadense TaxID=3634 RepID=A0A2P5WP33_GOSBA|nr:hypothetical protein GOBAR_AA27844 [Gossypium barbadense]
MSCTGPRAINNLSPRWQPGFSSIQLRISLFRHRLSLIPASYHAFYELGIRLWSADAWCTLPAYYLSGLRPLWYVSGDTY